MQQVLAESLQYDHARPIKTCPSQPQANASAVASSARTGFLTFSIPNPTGAVLDILAMAADQLHKQGLRLAVVAQMQGELGEAE